ncbi:MAG: hypothetical protein DI534_04885 [Leifsonia xyli]|nr:MAG: hypothetical protein DI534_04885 [Leifsonia xyli]
MAGLRVVVGSYSVPSEWTGTPYGHGGGIVAGVLAGDSLLMDPAGLGETNPSFVVADREARLLWAITEPEKGGELLAFPVDERGVVNGAPDRVVTARDAPCHLTVAPQAALVSHYHGGAVSIIGRAPDGRPSRLLAIVEPPASGSGWDRSGERSRPHSTLWLPGTRSTFLVADCGRDTLLLYRWRAETAAAELLDVLVLPAGTGPRHLAWHAATSQVLVSAQNTGAVAAVALDADRLSLRQLLTTSGSGRARVVPSEIAVHPAGRLAIMANRWDDSLTVFAIDARGTLAELASIDAGGVNPRHFAITPDGARVLVAHQESDEIAVFEFVGDALRLRSRTAVATPSCIAFWAE